jgi:hypothetical protein
VGVIILQDLLIRLDGQATEEVGYLDSIEITTETLKLVADLE